MLLKHEKKHINVFIDLIENKRTTWTIQGIIDKTYNTELFDVKQEREQAVQESGSNALMRLAKRNTGKLTTTENLAMTQRLIQQDIAEVTAERDRLLGEINDLNIGLEITGEATINPKQWEKAFKKALDVLEKADAKVQQQLNESGYQQTIDTIEGAERKMTQEFLVYDLDYFELNKDRFDQSLYEAATGNSEPLRLFIQGSANLSADQKRRLLGQAMLLTGNNTQEGRRSRMLSRIGSLFEGTSFGRLLQSKQRKALKNQALRQHFIQRHQDQEAQKAEQATAMEQLAQQAEEDINTTADETTEDSDTTAQTNGEQQSSATATDDQEEPSTSTTTSTEATEDPNSTTPGADSTTSPSNSTVTTPAVTPVIIDNRSMDAVASLPNTTTAMEMVYNSPLNSVIDINGTACVVREHQIVQQHHVTILTEQYTGSTVVLDASAATDQLCKQGQSGAVEFQTLVINQQETTSTNRLHFHTQASIL